MAFDRTPIACGVHTWGQSVLVAEVRRCQYADQRGTATVSEEGADDKGRNERKWDRKGGFNGKGVGDDLHPI